ncbi:MAG TPA: TolC family protein [Terriglobia bacterium]|nr:TolC family protein [Terriglobia bacterium]
MSFDDHDSSVRYRRPRWVLLLLLLMVSVARAARAQNAGVPAGSTPAAAAPATTHLSRLSFKPVPGQIAGPQGLRDYVVEGKLRLTLEDAIRLTLLNSPDVHINHTPVDQARFNLLNAYAPFDPKLTSNLGATRATTPSTNQLVGAPTLSTLFQGGFGNYSQTFETGTNIQASFNGNRSTTNSSFYFLNPYLTSNLGLQFTQPLLRNRGLFPNRAPIVIARRNLNQSQATFESSVNNSIQQAVFQYWNVVQARENLKVVEESLHEANATYQHDKRALELGALSPLDIYRSESQVAQRRVSEIQAEYQLKQVEDQFRQVIGADLDPFIQALDLDLVENPEPQGELYSIDAKTALEEAFRKRPELEAARQQLVSDETNFRLARNGLLPDLELIGNYASNGVGGNQITTASVIVPGGFGDALSQLFHFHYPTYGVTLQLNLPVHNRAAQAALGTASVARRNDLYQMRRQEQTVRLDVLNSVHQLEEAKLSVEAAKIARGLAQKTLESEQRKYELGAGQIFLVLEAQTELTQAEVSLVQAEVSYQLSLAAVDHATGGLLEKHRVEIKD